MAGYAAEDFALSADQKAERKLLVTCVNIGDLTTKSSGTPEWVPIGAGVEDSSIEYNADIETITDIMGVTETTVNKLEPSQNLEPMTIRGGNKVLFKLTDIIERNAVSELAQFEVLIIRAYVKEGSSYHAELHRGCTITPQSVGGSAYVDMPITINFSNDKVLGTVNGYTKHDTITFTANS